MEYSETKLVEYAKGQVSYWEMQKGKRMIFGFMGAAALFLLVFVLVALRNSFGISQEVMMQTEFLAGLFSGFILCLVVGMSVLAGLRLFHSFYGKETAALRLLVELAERKHTR